ncbi:MAG: hypothetical protein C5S40_00715 [ANME-2 cluster archaeon]|nr:hypothetical protein [ANME-2 cluster archaeon]
MIFILGNLCRSSPDELNTQIPCPVIELLIHPERSSHVNIHNIYFSFRVFFPEQLAILKRSHTTETGTVYIRVLVPASNTLNKSYPFGWLNIAWSHYLTHSRSAGINKPLEFHSSDHIIIQTEPEFILWFRIVHIITHRHHNNTHIKIRERFLLVHINSPTLTCPDTRTTVDTDRFIHQCPQWHCLWERCINSLSGTDSFIKLGIWHLHRALFCAQSATGTLINIDIPWLMLHLYLEVTNITINFLHFGITHNLDILIPCNFHHLRTKDTNTAIIGRKRLIKLGHLASDGWSLFYQVYLMSHISNIQCSLHTSNTGANNKSCIRHRNFT